MEIPLDERPLKREKVKRTVRMALEEALKENANQKRLIEAAYHEAEKNHLLTLDHETLSNVLYPGSF